MSVTRQTPLGSMSLREDGILHVVFDSDEVPTPESAAEFLAIRADLVGSSPPPVIVEIIRLPFADREIREAFMGDLSPPPCRAVVVTNRTADTIFRSFELVDPGNVPTRVFHRMDAAIAWIHETTADR